MNPALHAAIAAHRFGLGEPDLAVVGTDARGWLLSQIGPADAQRGSDLPGAAQALQRQIDFQKRLAPAAAAASHPAAEGMAAADLRPIEQQFVDTFRDLVNADLRARLATAATTARPFAERIAGFWCNHFTVSMAKPSARGLVGAFEREAIRPHIAGRFEDLLKGSTHHAGMLRYLDNHLSSGPHSRFARRQTAAQAARPQAARLYGLNENLAREVLELHTLGVSGGGGSTYGPWGGYDQRDVTAFAAVLTGWRVPGGPREPLAPGDPVRFEPAWHEPGPKRLLGRTYAEGPEALDAVLHDLAAHPHTARFIATKLARHFVADDPPPELVERLARRFLVSDGDLAAVYRELLEAPESWQPQGPKLKSPEEFVVSTARVLGMGDRLVSRAPDAGIALLGQRIQAAPSPAGWPDRAEEWLGPESVWKRIEWTAQVSERTGRGVDARALARRSLGPLLSPATAQQIDRAADGTQALALMLLSPDFQRR